MFKKVLASIMCIAMLAAVLCMPTSAIYYAYGDVTFDGAVNSADVLSFRQHLIGISSMTGNGLKLADVNGDEKYDVLDYLDIVMQTVGLKKRANGYAVDEWIAVPYTSKAQADAGIMGGEGCQWPTFIAFDPIDGKNAIFCTDVGGTYRSTDGGVTWFHSAVGISAEGSATATFDPNNTDRILLCGVNSSSQKNNGLQLSVNGGDTWKPVLTNQGVQGNRDFREAIAYDPNSYSSSIGGSAIAYWLKEDGTLFRTNDGGETWTNLSTNSNFSGGEVAVSPNNSSVYVASTNGFFVSTNNGVSFTKVRSESFLGMDVILTRPNNVYLCSPSGLFVSTNNGSSFTSSKGTNYPTDHPARIEVSPSNPDYMILDNDFLKYEGKYSNKAYYTHDGGRTWNAVTRDTSGSIIPYNTRQNVFSWHPTNTNICISLGGDMILRSTNGGAKFTWSGSGYNGAACTGISYNVNNPNLMYCSNQDYCGFYSTDAGKTWKYCNWNAGWGGFTYGGYVVDENTVVVVNKLNNQFYISYTTDGGNTRVDTGINVGGKKNVTGCPGDNNMVYCGNYRSADKGVTWTQMSNCDNVMACDPSTGALYGYCGNNIVKSTDKGYTWTTVGEATGGILDMTYDCAGKRVLYISTSKLYLRAMSENGVVSMVTDFSSKKDGYGTVYNLRCVQVDPTNSNVIYVGNACQTYASDVGCLMTTNGGKTWTNLASTRDNILPGADGGREITRMCLNPLTRELFVSGSCRGVYKRTLPGWQLP